MTESRSENPGTKFDLSELAQQLAKADSGTAVLGWITTGVGVFLDLVGLYVAAFQVTPTDVAQVILGLLVIASGVAVVVASRLMMRAASAYPTQLEFVPHGFRLGGSELDSWELYRWDDRKFNLTMFDRTGVSLPPGGSMDRPTFTILPWKGKKAAVPKVAFELILAEAHARGMTISRQEFGSNVKRWGLVVVTSVRAPTNR